jgi:hypothetical protein
MLLQELFEAKITHRLLKQTDKSLIEKLHKFRRFVELDPSNTTKKETLANLEKQAKERAKEIQSDGTWEDEVRHLYVIKKEGEDKFIVHSDAKDWKQQKTWEFATWLEAFDKITMLVMYKDRDRKAGFGDKDKDFDRVDAVRAKREKGSAVTENRWGPEAQVPDLNKVVAELKKHGAKEAQFELGNRGTNRVHFTMGGNDFTMTILDDKCFNLVTPGYKDDLEVGYHLKTLADVIEHAKSVNKKWFKENDPHYERGL